MDDNVIKFPPRLTGDDRYNCEQDLYEAIADAIEDAIAAGLTVCQILGVLHYAKNDFANGARVR